jgi:hypothetical protein
MQLNYRQWMCVLDGEGLRLLLIRLRTECERKGGTDRVDEMKVGLREVSRKVVVGESNHQEVMA